MTDKDNVNKDIKELTDLLERVQKLSGENSDITLGGIDMEDVLYSVSNDEFNILTKFTNESNNEDPSYAKIGDSGFDLRAFIPEPVTLQPLERKLIPTGLKFELPEGVELQVRPRSGMALKHGISVLNTPGTVDDTYRGDVGIIAVNLSNEPYTIQPGERIAQGVLMHVIGQRISLLKKVETLNETERGETGFGSTGKD
jgi:dUTP pyrophosphatase